MSGEWFRETQEPRACEGPGCGYVRMVKVTRTPTEPEGYWSRLCTACEADMAARKHERAALKLRKRAAELRKRRQTLAPRCGERVESEG